VVQLLVNLKFNIFLIIFSGVKSFLADYENKLNGQSCPRTIDAIDNSTKQLINIMRNCKELYFGTKDHGLGSYTCFSDADCKAAKKYIPGVSNLGSCDLRYRVCVPLGRYDQERGYVSCLINPGSLSSQERLTLLASISAEYNITISEGQTLDITYLANFLVTTIFSAQSCVKNYDLPGYYMEFDSSVAPCKKISFTTIYYWQLPVQ
jgi:hypothetical protein